MSLADHLGVIAVVGGCGACRWYASLDEGDRAALDAVVVAGGSKSALWRSCTTWPDNPLPVKLSSFKNCLSTHNRQEFARDAR